MCSLAALGTTTEGTILMKDVDGAGGEEGVLIVGCVGFGACLTYPKLKGRSGLQLRVDRCIQRET